MDSIDRTESGFVDMYGTMICNNDIGMYNMKTYHIMYVGKDGIEWICHPCGNNQKTEDLNLADIYTELAVRRTRDIVR